MSPINTILVNKFAQDEHLKVEAENFKEKSKSRKCEEDSNKHIKDMSISYSDESSQKDIDLQE